MKSIVKISIILLIIGSIGNLLANSPIGLTLKMRGNISLSREDKTTALSEGETLLNNDTLRSRENSSAFIKFIDDGATLRMFENSVLTLKTEMVGNKLNKTNYLEVGNVFTSVRKNTGDLTVETPTTVASVKGTDGFVVVTIDGKTVVIVLKGSYEVYNKRTGETTTVTAGNTCSSDGLGNLEIYPTSGIDQGWLDEIEGDSMDTYDTFNIELIREEDGEKKKVEIELD